jgi:lipoate-protein ligase A
LLNIGQVRRVGDPVLLQTRRIRQHGELNASQILYHQLIFCDLTLPSPEQNLACDEALLELCENGVSGELLRLWEPAQYFVALGYGNKVHSEVHLPFCQQNMIPIIRRSTGGGTVLQGPGVLNYSLILRSDPGGPLHSIPATNDFILRRNQTALTALLDAPVEVRGHTDLSIGGLKFSGNAQRRRKHFLIFHGSFLLHMDLGLIEKALPMPSKQPDYRLNRGHSEFLMNLNVPASIIISALAKAWNASERLAVIPFDRISELARERYGNDEWNFKF